MKFLAKTKFGRRSIKQCSYMSLGLMIGLNSIELSQAQINGPLFPIPMKSAEPTASIILGSKIFFDKRLSRDGTVSCASCHNFSTGGADNRTYSTGVGNSLGQINAPTVLNSGLNYVQFWDGRATSLESQIDGPIANVNELGTNWPDVVKKLSGDEKLKQLSLEAYGENLSAENIKKAIADFERSLTTPNSRFDHYLNGEQEALSSKELRGYESFKRFGCTACHQGVNIGGNMFQKLGVANDYFGDVAKHRALTSADMGRYNVTHDPADRFYFRVPSLRNVALTAPYFHDGSQKTLEQAVHTMGHYQLGRELKPDQISAIVAFLKTLTGEMPRTIPNEK